MWSRIIGEQDNFHRLYKANEMEYLRYHKETSEKGIAPKNFKEWYNTIR